VLKTAPIGGYLKRLVNRAWSMGISAA